MGDPSGPESVFLSTPSARRATDVYALIQSRLDISIHALCEEGDIISWGVNKLLGGFLSTPSARRATSSLNTDTGGAGNFYPRPPRGGRRRGESR